MNQKKLEKKIVITVPSKIAGFERKKLKSKHYNPSQK